MDLWCSACAGVFAYHVLVFFLQMLMNVQIPQPALVARVSTLLVVTPVSALQILSWIPPELDALVRDCSLCYLQVKLQGGRCKANCLGVKFQVVEQGWNRLSSSHRTAPGLEVVIVQ